MAEPAPFFVGLNLPWQQYGCDFGANRWQPEGGLAQSARRLALSETFARAVDVGTRELRWFLLCDGRAGIRYGPDGRTPRLDEAVRRDLDAALDLLARHLLRATFVLLDFHWFRRPSVSGHVQLGGRHHLIADRDVRARLIDDVLVPIVGHCRGCESVAAWDVVNEPEWATIGLGPPWNMARLAFREMRAFLDSMLDALREAASQPLTIGLAGLSGLDLAVGLPVAVHHVHWYDHFGLDEILSRRVASLGLDRPLVLGEFPTRDTALGARTIVDAARRAGYAGAFAWSLLADDAASDPARALDVVRWSKDRGWGMARALRDQCSAPSANAAYTESARRRR